MTFNEGIRIDPNRVKTSKASKGGAVVGIGGILAMLLFMFTGVDLSGVLGGGGQGASEPGQSLDHCKDAGAANQYVECRMVATATIGTDHIGAEIHQRHTVAESDTHTVAG